MIRIVFISTLIALIFLSCSSSDGKMNCVRGKVENQFEITGYTDLQGYFPGDTVLLAVHSKTPRFSIDLIRHTRNRDTVSLGTFSNGMQQDYDSCAYLDGCNWVRTNHIQLPLNSPSGYYTIRLYNDQGEWHVPFVVKDKTLKKVVVMSSTNTWQAYNTWGGASFYKNAYQNEQIRDRSTIVSFDRPNNIYTGIRYEGHLFDAELSLYHWLIQENYPFTVIDEHSFERMDVAELQGKTLLLNTHSEYWTAKMYDQLENFIQNGNHLMCLSGNSIYRKITRKGNAIECWQMGGIHEHDNSTGGEWGKDLGRPEGTILGVEYDANGYGTYMPYMVWNPDHWIFTNTNATKGQVFGKSLNGVWASGHETDKISENSPENVQLLAIGLNREQMEHIGGDPSQLNPLNGGGQMVYFENKYGGKVFSGGSITYCGGLLIDDLIPTITKNVLDKFISGD